MKLPFFAISALSLLLALAACNEQGFPDFTRERAQAQKAMSLDNPPIAVEPPPPVTKGVTPGSVPAMKVALLLPLSGDSVAV
ncbi:MAG: hypothetical protein K2Q01_00400, partial [Rickettsiales bacterium]|nr:hypothetical protein [Rickettsiales bacterium]